MNKLLKDEYRVEKLNWYGSDESWYAVQVHGDPHEAQKCIEELIVREMEGVAGQLGSEPDLAELRRNYRVVRVTEELIATEKDPVTALLKEILAELRQIARPGHAVAEPAWAAEDPE